MKAYVCPSSVRETRLRIIPMTPSYRGSHQAPFDDGDTDLETMRQLTAARNNPATATRVYRVGG